MKNKDHYVYCYLDPRRPGKYTFPGLNFCFLYQPFYIGKGSGNRWKHHLWNLKNYKKFNPYKCRKINAIRKKLNIDPYIQIISYFNTAKEAYEEEAKFIHLIGRTCNKTGPLTNLADGGGEESKNYWTPERKKQRSIDNIGSNNPMYGKSIYEVWLERYGKEEADIRQKNLCQKRKEIALSKNTSGKNNPMYGKSGESNPNYKPIDIDKFISLIKSGIRKEDIAFEMNISISKVSSELKRIYKTPSLREVRKILNGKSKS